MSGRSSRHDLTDAETPLAHAEEADRLEELRRLEILDSPDEESFNRLVRLAAHICQAPISLMNLIDSHRQWSKARFGIELREVPRSIALCAEAIRSDEVMIVEDLVTDARFAGNPMTTGAAALRFYAGAPLRTRNGARLGTLCVADRRPRILSAEQRDRLADLAAVAVNEMELRLLNRHLTELNQIDGMTGAYNRRHFLELAEIELVRARRYRRALAMLVYDIDHFKNVNDTFGHAAGDVAIVTAVREARAILRSQDVLGRIGGEEFAVLLPETDVAGAQLIAERLREQLAATALEHGGINFSITVSVGVARADPGRSIAQAMLSADTALYAAKRGGRNRVEIAGQ